ncbi:helix-turn-helix domain-containing protein [Amycolatopsis sp. DG1A-15b]|uniref:TetR/AcrR family transcriptional regulator n=1 Tax=Amycolatopsis sp. DG1A-15b TaxID=3052846 RepID=UPI00255B630A|nr:helix-turn-helix domain-containing protein [Amycolatopsis sp. DG1A-15b]WIX90368.1 helix-turn-helix domain-containing protein [Amycolatopsis sp. DG1A-15b]
MGTDSPRAYRSSRREAQARTTRRRVVEAATAVFLERGFAGATMRAIAGRAGVSVPTVELAFGTKAQVLKAAIDVAIAGDDEPVPVLERGWTDAAVSAATVGEFLDVVSDVLGSAQERSAGLVLAVFEAAATTPELAGLAEQMTAQRVATAAWIVDQLASLGAVSGGFTRQEAVDTVWILMDPAVFDRLTRRRQWTRSHYQRWFAHSLVRLLTGGSTTSDSL